MAGHGVQSITYEPPAPVAPVATVFAETPVVRSMAGGTRGAAVLRLAAFLLFALLVQWISGAYSSTIRANEADEPAHIVTGLMVRDYVATSLGEPPMEFARQYYVHYPKVALGHWPPLFYTAQAAWMLVFPASRDSLLVMMALCSALIAAGLFPLLRRECGAAAAWCACLLLLTVPGMAASGATIMTEIPLALTMLGAMLAFGRYLDAPHWRPALLFGVLASAALLLKGTGIALAAMPPFALLLTRRWRLLLRADFWLPAAVVLSTALPWYLFAPFALHERTAKYGAAGKVVSTLPQPLTMLAQTFGWPVALLGAFGFSLALVTLWRNRTGLAGAFVAASALGLSAIVFPYFVPAWRSEHLVESSGAFTLLASLSGARLWSLLRRSVASPRLAAVALVVCLASLGVWNLATVLRQAPSGYGALGEQLAQRRIGPADRPPVVLIAASAPGEGSLIAEVAQREQRPASYLLRASKVLAEMDWMGQHRRDRFPSAEQLRGFLASQPIDLVVLDDAWPAPHPYRAQLERALASDPEHWRPLRTQAPPRFRIYSAVAPRNLSPARRTAQLSAIGGPPQAAHTP